MTIVCVNLIIIVLIVTLKLKKPAVKPSQTGENTQQQQQQNKRSKIVTTRMDIGPIITSFLFSGVTWILVPIYLVGDPVPDYADSPLNDKFFAVLAILNSLQGVFLFIHYMFTIQIILDRKKINWRWYFIKVFLKEKKI